jgi:hypothetical protein
MSLLAATGSTGKFNDDTFQMNLKNPTAEQVHKLEKLIIPHAIYPMDCVEVDGIKYIFKGFPDGHTEITQID